MDQRDQILVTRIGDLNAAFVRGEFVLAAFCDRLEALLAEIETAAVRSAFEPAQLALAEVRGAVGDTRGFYHTFDAGLEAWAVAQIETLVIRFGRPHPSQAGR